MANKVTTMVLKVDLECAQCYKKVKKTLCKFPQIRDQVYDEQKNTVTIKVVSSCPEIIRDKIRCKGGVSIKNIEIKAPEEPPKQPTEKTNGEGKPKTPEEKKKKPCKTKSICVDRPPCSPQFFPPGVCFREWSDGCGCRKCYPNAPQPQCYCDGCCRRPAYDSRCDRGCKRGYCGCRSDCSCEDNPPCKIM